MYFDDDAVISKNNLEWEARIYTRWKEYFDINAFIVFKIPYSETY